MTLTNFFISINLFIATLCFLTKKASCNSIPDSSYLDCRRPRNCSDGQDIHFPFFIQDPTPQNYICGYPGFNLSCSPNGNPVIRIPKNDYIVRQIFYQNQSLRVSNAADFDTRITCIPPISNVSLLDGRFRLSNSNRLDLFLFYNCNTTALVMNDTDPGSLIKHKVDCFGGNETNSTLAIFEDDPQFGYVAERCRNGVAAPVVVGGGGGEVKGMLERGFMMTWTASDCSVCEASRGRCGFNLTTYQFKCFCPDRPHALRCADESGNPRLDLKIGLGSNKLPLILVLVFSVVGSGVLVIIVLCFIRKCCWRKMKEEDYNIGNFLKNCGSLAPRRYTYSEVKKITKSFKDRLGQGGYGEVFKGKLSEGGLVAVKVLTKSKTNGEDFINEVASISRTSHVNIVTLLGFCFEGSKRALIYEYMSGGSLDKYIYEESCSNDDRQLGWETLLNIAIGIAQGLEYLHRGCNTRILHFDIKPHNILLDEKFCPKVSDFGLAKICPQRESIISMMGARGTPGYIAPEVFCRNFGGVSHKSDVYSYGMMVLEMVGGRKNIHVEVENSSEIYFPHWIHKRLELGEDLGLRGTRNDEERQIAKKMILVSFWCIQTNPSDRPAMGRVVEMLQGSLESLPIPPKPYLSSPTRSSETLVSSSPSTLILTG